MSSPRRKLQYEELLARIPVAHVTQEVMRVYLTQPSALLKFISQARGKRLSIDEFEMLQPWGIAAISALSRSGQKDRIFASAQGATRAGTFAYALGFADVRENIAASEGETGRTLKLRRVNKYEEIESAAFEIAKMVISDEHDPGTGKDEYIDSEEVSKTLAYVIIELLRNVLQHSHDQLGGVVIAQRMDKGRGIGYDNESFIQVAVADCGIGIYESIRETRPEINTPEMALERSIWPRVSGKFYAGQRGGAQNAGLGLFFVSEMAKRTAGRLLIASKGAAFLLQGDPDGLGNNTISPIEAEYPGTLVVFDMPKRGVSDYDSLIKTIQELAYTRMVKSEKSAYIRFANVPKGAFEFSVKIAAENTAKAEYFSEAILLKKIAERIPVVFNFANVRICTQSFLHALLFGVLQEASKHNVALFAINLNDTVKDQVRLVEMYTLGEDISVTL